MSSTSIEMSPGERALARSNAYGLFSQLYQQGLTQTLLPYVRAINVPDSLVPTVLDVDQQAAIHQDLFGFNVFPFEGVFVDAPSALGGPATAAVQHFYRQAGHVPRKSDVAADHIVLELGLMAFLSRTEADGLATRNQTAVSHSRNLQRQFLDQHLLLWLPALFLAICQQGESFFQALAELTLELVLDHRQTLDEDPAPPPASFFLPEAHALLENPNTGLREVAAYLLTPAHCGLYLSRDDIARLGRQVHLPRGFGDRRQMLTNLLKSAAEYDSLPVLVTELQQTVLAWQDHYQHWRKTGPLVMVNIASAWMKRLSATDSVLTKLAGAQSSDLS